MFQIHEDQFTAGEGQNFPHDLVTLLPLHGPTVKICAVCLHPLPAYI